MRVGNALQGDVEQGPLINQAALRKVEAHVADALQKGATVLTGGKPHALGGTFYEPTVLANASGSMLIASEETFGPVAACFRFLTEEDAIKAANDTPFGLGSYVFTTDPEQAKRVADKIEAGMVFVNAVGAEGAELPFGGVKRSGFGRELGRFGIDEFVNKKLIRIAG